jgi:glycosyltransferase involved in cell wall biosynthesis
MSGDINIFISEYSRDKWGWDKNEAEVIHHGVDTELFIPNKYSRDGSWDIVDREPRVLSVLHDWINRDWGCGFTLWNKIVNCKEADLPCYIIGDTPGLSEPAPSTQALVDEYRRSRIFLNTSIVAPVPTALLEAMTCGCAIVSTATCMIPEIIENRVNGLLSNNPTQLREYVDELLNDEELATELGNAARNTICERFSMKGFVKNWKEVFKQCVS